MVGLEPGTLTVVAGRASMGKSFIATNLALEIMLLHKLPVAIFSLEMTKKQLEYRLWSMISVHDYYQHLKLSPLESDRIRRHRGGEKPLKEWEFENINKIVGTARELPLYINDCRKISVAGIASACRQIVARQGKLGLVIGSCVLSVLNLSKNKLKTIAGLTLQPLLDLKRYSLLKFKP